MRIDGEIQFTEIKASFSGATVIVRVEDCGRADASAVVVAEQKIADVSRAPGERESVPFSIDYQASGDAANYSLRAHVDVDSSGEVSPGDYVSTQSYPLAGIDPPARLTVEVEPVG
ncbi:MAG: YbaY family lipoprotein [Pyrinomonadaceae bacterium]